MRHALAELATDAPPADGIFNTTPISGMFLPTQLATATDARLMLAINALPQDAWTPQDLRLPNDWAIPIPHGIKATPSVPPAATPWSKSTFLAGRALALSLDELQVILPRTVPRRAAARGEDPRRCEWAHRLHLFEGPLGCGLTARGGEGDASSTLTRLEGMKEGAALGWDDVRSSAEGIITREITGDTHANSPFERQMTYSASFDAPQREQYYETTCRYGLRHN